MPGGALLPRLTSLRLFAAAVVVFFHLDVWGVASLPASLATVGYVGVSFFFVLSGVVLTWGTRPGLPARTFWRRRFARVWPNHAVMLAVAVVIPLVPVARGWPEAWPNALLIQAWWRDGDVAFGMNGVSWSLSCEAFFYACFPLTVLVLRRLPGVLRWCAAGAGLVVCLAAALYDPEWAFHLPAARFGEFLLGVVAGLALREGWRPRIPVAVAGVVAVLGTALSFALPMPVPDTAMAVPFLVVILCAVGRDQEGKAGWLASRPMVFAGEASFALYLVHELVILNLRPYVHVSPWFDAAVMALVACLAAAALHLGVERPMNRRLRGGSRSLALADPHLPPVPRSAEA